MNASAGVLAGLHLALYISTRAVAVSTHTPLLSPLVLPSMQFWCGGQMGMARGAVWSRSLS